MINAYNISEQTLEENDAITFDGFNFGRNRFTCDNNPSNFLVTRNGSYEITASLNVAPTVAGQMTFNIVSSGSDIPGGEILLPGATVGTFENGSTSVIVNLFAGTRISVVNRTADPVTLPAQGASIIVKRVA